MSGATKGDPACPVCEGRGYFFDPRGKYLYCDCEANKREGGIATHSDCFLHGEFVGIFCPKCERESGR